MPSLHAFIPDFLSVPSAQHADLKDTNRTSELSCDLQPMSVPSYQKHFKNSLAASKWAGNMNVISLKASRQAKSSQINKRLDQVRLVGNKLVFVPSLENWHEEANKEEVADRTALHQTLIDSLINSIKTCDQQKAQQLQHFTDQPQTSSGQVAECIVTSGVKAKTVEVQPESSNFRTTNIHVATTTSNLNLAVPRRTRRINPNRFNQVFSAAGMQTNMSATTVLPESKSLNNGLDSSKLGKNRDVGRHASRSSKWATPAELRGECGIEQNIDTSRDQPNSGFEPQVVSHNHELQDWTGGWAPPPVEWENRDSYVEPLIADRVKNWQGTCVLLDHTIDIGDKRSTVAGDIAPRIWKRLTIEGIAADTWYRGQMPVELENLDPAEPLCAPWWYTYTTDRAEHLRLLDVPVARLDPKDNDMSKAMQQTSEHTLLSHENQNLKKANNERKAKAQQRAFEKEIAAYVPPPNKHAPTINLYIRPAIIADMPQIREIWNHYIEKTIFCPEMQTLTGTQVRVRWEDITQCNLPFLVAVDISSKGNRRHGLEGYGRVRSEPVLGFAFADDHNDVRGMYRYTVEIDMFVKPSLLRKGVGRCLLDKVMSVLDPCYDVRGGYDFVGDEMRYAPGGKRLIGSIMVNIPYDSKDKKRAMWMQKWLSGWDFEQAGELFDVGHKLNTIVSQIILIKKTGSTIHAWAP